MRQFGSIEAVADAALELWHMSRDKGDGDIPRWRDVPIRALADFSERFVLLKYGDGDDPQLRYRGTVVEDMLGVRAPVFKATGEDRAQAIRTHRACLAQPCGAIVRRRAQFVHPAGVTAPIDYQMLVLPARDEGGETDLLMIFNWTDNASFGAARKLSKQARIALHRVDFVDLGFGVPANHLDLDIVTEVEFP